MSEAAAGQAVGWHAGVPCRWAPLVSGFGPVRSYAEPHMVRMADGVRLATDVYLPGRAGKVPAILIRTCYDKCGVLLDLPSVADELTVAGFAVVAQDVRGQFRSEGERMPFFHEVRDGYDTLDWIARQTWSDGTAGMLGPSYLGFAQWAAVASGHPALRALSLTSTSQIVPPTWWGPAIASPAGVEWLVAEWSCAARIESGILDWSHRPFCDIIPADLTGARRLLGTLRALARKPARLQARAYPRGLPAATLRIPALHAGGWWDPVNRWAMRDWATASGQAPAAGEQELLMAAADHIGRRFGAEPADRPSGPGAAMALDASVAFFDRHLRHHGDGRPPRVRYEIARGPWLTADSWPPPGARGWTLHLADGGRATGSLAGGALARRPDRIGATAAWVHDPSAPVPALGGDLVEPLPHEAAAHLRPDVATFTSEPVRGPVDLAGPAFALIVIESTAPSCHVIVTLVDLAPDGEAHQLLEGISLADTLHGPARVAVDLGTTAVRLRPGHRLRLAVASSRFPTYLPHPGTDGDVWTATVSRPARQRLHTGGPGSSVLQLTVRAPRR